MTTSARVIFLDVDGVLNSRAFFVRAGIAPCADVRALDPAAVARLNAIVARTAARIVLSSTWRILYAPEAMTAMLRSVGYTGPDIIGETPRERLYGRRGLEIAAWRKSARHRGPYVVLDDDTDAASAGNWVQTTWDEGLLDEHIDEATRWLVKGPRGRKVA